MRLVLTDPGRARVIAVLPAELAPEVARNPAYAALALWLCEGDVYEGDAPPDALTPVDRANPVAPSAESLADYASRRRWEIEVGGTTWQGVPVATDDRSKTLVNGELAAIDLGERVDGEAFKFADGLPRPLTNAEMQAVAVAMRGHVKATFAALFGVLAALQAGTVTTRQQVDVMLAGDA